MEAIIFGAQKRLEIPTLAEGFHRIIRVELIEGDGFRMGEMPALEENRITISTTQ